jgi:hypothetical protein
MLVTTDPIRVGKGGAYAILGSSSRSRLRVNSQDIGTRTQPAGHDPNQRGFTVQVSLNLQRRDFTEGTRRFCSPSIPAVNRLQNWKKRGWKPFRRRGTWCAGGQILSDHRINTQHPHAWSFVDSPLVNARFGAGRLAQSRGRLAWLIPLPFSRVPGRPEQPGETAASCSSGHRHNGGDEETLPFGYRHADNDRIEGSTNCCSRRVSQPRRRHR